MDGLRPCLEVVDKNHVEASSLMEEHAHQPMGGLRKRFRGVSIEGDKVILHKERSGEALHLFIGVADQVSYLRVIHAEEAPVLFKEIGGPEGSRLGVKEAAWPDGSRVLLDSRGLLHFVSSAPEVEDFSVILTSSGALCLWAASLGGLGDAYYFDQEPLATSEEFAQLLREFVKQTRC